MRNDPLNLETMPKRTDAKALAYAVVADEIRDRGELRFAEHLSVYAQISQPEADGFRITREAVGFPNAFIVEAGTSEPAIGFMDGLHALAGLCQEPRSLSASIRQLGGCGHNLPEASAMLAAFATRDTLAAPGQCGTIRYYGCSDKEEGSGKTFMAMATSEPGAIRDPGLLAHAKAELRGRTGGDPYACLIPLETMAPLLRHLIKEPA